MRTLAAIVRAKLTFLIMVLGEIKIFEYPNPSTF